MSLFFIRITRRHIIKVADSFLLQNICPVWQSTHPRSLTIGRFCCLLHWQILLGYVPFNLSIILPSSIIDCALLNIMSVSRGIGLLQRPPLSALHFQLIRVKERGRGRFKDKEEEGGRGADKRRRGEGGDRPKRAFSPERGGGGRRACAPNGL